MLLTPSAVLTAELASLAVLHRDKDFDIIADATGQQLERLRLDE
ncbi:hypothetical protein [Egicoccus halophilus]|uniref:PIN domain-containing protein n=1 Tax=Egicoccus halophilus TaxID=1670830 RepID=A0A8J3AFD2_9ACTN|nr:hypothetical protein [Egicoccus halophilus]GGI06638.1 hypothetical protein GCM10011354_20090 [Egicoccus halophilus]